MAFFDVIGVGVNAVDVLVRMPAYVPAGGKYEVQDLMLQGGGLAATATCVCASLGWQTGYVARMGDNTLSQIARVEYLSRGILPDLYEPSMISATSGNTRPSSSPTKVLVPVSTVIGRSVLSLRVRQGIPRTVVSSCTPPESVSTARAPSRRLRNSMYPNGLQNAMSPRRFPTSRCGLVRG